MKLEPRVLDQVVRLDASARIRALDAGDGSNLVDSGREYARPPTAGTSSMKRSFAEDA
jgi:hypothetical protein